MGFRHDTECGRDLDELSYVWCIVRTGSSGRCEIETQRGNGHGRGTPSRRATRDGGVGSDGDWTEDEIVLGFIDYRKVGSVSPYSDTRAYALQRQGHLFFDGPIPQPPPGHQVDATGNHLRLLAIVFSHIDLHFVHCHNTMCEPTTCTRLSRAKVVHALKALSGSAEQVFGDVDALHSLSESQKADLLITWQWLRNRIWKIGFNHGFMTESGEEELRLEHVVEIASNCVAICQRLSLLSMEAHGTGFVEKLYDIASIVTDLVSGSGASPGAWEVIQSEKWGETLQALSDFISKHRAGIDFKGPIAGVKAFVNCVNVLLAPEAEHLGI